MPSTLQYSRWIHVAGIERRFDGFGSAVALATVAAALGTGR
jgi:hypothetical protein